MRIGSHGKAKQGMLANRHTITHIAQKEGKREGERSDKTRKIIPKQKSGARARVVHTHSNQKNTV